MPRLLSFVFLTCLLGSPLDGAEKTPPPNVVVLLADDLGINDLSCYGRKDLATPHIDQLAAQGLRCTSAYAAASVCSASRAALLTGLAPARLGITTFLPGRPERSSHRLLAPPQNLFLTTGVRTLAELLKPAGYRTAAVGKWHLGGKAHQPTDHGFDEYFQGKANPGNESPAGGKGEIAQAEYAEKFIGENKTKPFFLYVAFDSPHIPLGAPAAAVAAQSGAFNPKYAATVAGLDHAVGKILAALKAHGLEENTLVIFASDNGGVHVPELKEDAPTHNTPYRAGKGFLYEGGIRVPLIFRFPGRFTTRTLTVPVCLGDLTPTIAALTGTTPAAAAYDYLDLSPLLFNSLPAPTANRPLAWHQPHYVNQGGRPSGALRDGDWKLLEHYEDGSLELYNVKEDAAEKTDLAAQQPAKVAELRGKLEAWRRKVGAQGMQPNPQFNRAAWEACFGQQSISQLTPQATAKAMTPALAAWRAAMDLSPPAGTNTVLVLEAREAKVKAEKMRYEDPPQKDTLGYWVNAADTAAWTFTASTAGKYRVTILQGCGKGSAGSTVALEVGSSQVAFTVVETGHFQRFIAREVGTLELVSGTNTLTVRPLQKKGGAIMDLRRITLERIE